MQKEEGGSLAWVTVQCFLYTVSCSISGTISSISGVHTLPVNPSHSVSTIPTVSLSTALASAPFSQLWILQSPPTVVLQREFLLYLASWQTRRNHGRPCRFARGSHSRPSKHNQWSGDCCNFCWYSKKSCTITDILTWLQAFSILTAILVSSENTTKEEASGRTAHSYLIIQLSKDQQLKYDQQF